ncbi:MAG: hypothetical protein ACREV5_09760 [Steroidobacter sp.]
MGISETIIAAMIGAMATVSTALFQIFTMLRNRGKIDVRPKRGSATRSILAVLALMVASAAGGFLYSEFIKQRNSEDMRAMRQELKEVKELTAQVAAARRADAAAAARLTPSVDAAPAMLPAALHNDRESVESVVYVPACRRTSSGSACAETEAQRIALCGTIPTFARVDRIDLFAQPDAVQDAWSEHRAQLEQDLGGARFTGKSFEYAQGLEQKAVCVNFTQWSSDHPHIARILVQYGFGEAPAIETAPMATPLDAASSSPTPAVIAAEGLPASSQPASFTSTAGAP